MEDVGKENRMWQRYNLWSSKAQVSGLQNPKLSDITTKNLNQITEVAALLQWLKQEKVVNDHSLLEDE